MPLTIAPSCTVANSSLAIGTGPVSRTRALYWPAKLRSVAACRIASVASLPGSSALIVEHRLELDEGAAVGIGQRLVADEFAPGERRRPLVQDVLDRLADQVEGPLGIVELDLPALDAGKPGLQRAGQAADRGIAGHDLDQRRGGFELAGDLADLFHRQEQQPVLLEELAGTERLHRFEILGVAGQFSASALARGAGEFRRRRLDHGQDQLFAVERLLELVVALAPVEVGRNQLVDVGVDGEMPGRIEARPDRQEQREDDDESGKPRTGSDNRDDNTGQHIRFFLNLKGACRKRPLSSGVPEADLMLFWLLPAGFNQKSPKRTETGVRGRYSPSGWAIK